jgi:hypothetical protein
MPSAPVSWTSAASLDASTQAMSGSASLSLPNGISASLFDLALTQDMGGGAAKTSRAAHRLPAARLGD